MVLQAGNWGDVGPTEVKANTARDWGSVQQAEVKVNAGLGDEGEKADRAATTMQVDGTADASRGRCGKLVEAASEGNTDIDSAGEGVQTALQACNWGDVAPAEVEMNVAAIALQAHNQKNVGVTEVKANAALSGGCENTDRAAMPVQIDGAVDASRGGSGKLVEVVLEADAGTDSAQEGVQIVLQAGNRGGWGRLK